MKKTPEDYQNAGKKGIKTQAKELRKKCRGLNGMSHVEKRHTRGHFSGGKVPLEGCKGCRLLRRLGGGGARVGGNEESYPEVPPKNGFAGMTRGGALKNKKKDKKRQTKD